MKLFYFLGHPRDAWEENDRPNQWGTCTGLYSKSKIYFLHFNQLNQDEINTDTCVIFALAYPVVPFSYQHKVFLHVQVSREQGSHWISKLLFFDISLIGNSVQLGIFTTTCKLWDEHNN